MRTKKNKAVQEIGSLLAGAHKDNDALDAKPTLAEPKQKIKRVLCISALESVFLAPMIRK